MNPEWRTATVVALCQSMRESQDFSATPILADALQDVGCDDADMLATLRRSSLRYSEAAIMVAEIWDAKGQSSVEWLRSFVDRADCPGMLTTFAAATGHHDENDGGDGYMRSSRWDEYLHFGGIDAHGEIPPEFWDHVQIVSGKPIDQADRASDFSCSC